MGDDVTSHEDSPKQAVQDTNSRKVWTRKRGDSIEDNKSGIDTP